MRRVGGRGRSLIHAVLKVRRQRAMRTPPNWLRTPNIQRPGQEVGLCGQETGKVHARGIGNRTVDDGPWTDDMETDSPR